MRSPFPGMNPFLEQSELWSAVHSRLIVAIADSLIDQLSDKYRIEVEKRTYISEDGTDNLLVGIPDVAVLAQPTARETTATLLLDPQPQRVQIPDLTETTERFLEIREIATGKVITIIELLSPKNKRTGEGRTAYLRKRNQILSGATNLVEIDLLRAGLPMPMTPTNNPGTYRILLCRSQSFPWCDLYAFNLRQIIPTIPIPLLPGDHDAQLDLQTQIHYIYDRGRYHLAIDYNTILQPLLSEADQTWLKTFA
jgi:hypothetical protein